jgi:hypothetical protein
VVENNGNKSNSSGGLQIKASKSHLEAQLKSTWPSILVPTPAENSIQPSILLWARLYIGEINTCVPFCPCAAIVVRRHRRCPAPTHTSLLLPCTSALILLSYTRHRPLSSLCARPGRVDAIASAPLLLWWCRWCPRTRPGRRCCGGA